jgi:hypothetical protein
VDEAPNETESVASSTETSKPVLPTEWPSSIVPQREETDGESDDEDGEQTIPQTLAGAKLIPHEAGTTLVSILLTKALSWSWLLSQSDASAQVFAYLPVLIADSLQLKHEEVTTVSLEAWEPPGWKGEPSDV